MLQQHSNEDVGAAFARLRQSLRSYLRRRIPDAAQAEDLLQDIFVKALTSQHAGHRIGNLTGWLYAAARSTLVDHYRAKGEPPLELDDNIPEREAEDLRLHEELSNCLGPFVAELPPIYRDTLIATDLQGETMRSFAERQAVSVSAIKSRVVRARAMLKDKVLACCQVEMTDGMVTDCHRVSAHRCGAKCA